MSRLLLLMTTSSYKAKGFMTAAARFGVDLTVGMERPQALARLNPAGHLTLDFRDHGRSVRKIVDSARDHPIDAVLAADDDGAVLAAEAAAALGLAHSPVAAVSAARNKLETRKALRRAGLATPWFESFSLDDDPAAAAERVRYPCVLKPLSLAASRGVIRADDGEGLAAAWQRLRAILGPGREARDGPSEILAEGFIPGFEVALEGLVTRGRPKVLAIFDKPDPLDGPFFEETIYTTPSRHPEATRRQIVTTTAQALEALGLDHGPVHAELRCDGTRAWVLEIAPRSIGGLCSRALAFDDPGGGRLSLEDLILRHALGHPVERVEREPSAAGVMMIPIPSAGILRRVGGARDAARVDGIDEVKITVPPGQAVAPPPEGSRYLGFLFAHAETPESVEAALRESHGRLEIEIEPDAHEPGAR